MAYNKTVDMLHLDILGSSFKRTEFGNTLWRKLRPQGNLKS